MTGGRDNVTLHKHAAHGHASASKDRQSGEPPLYTLPASVGWCELGWSPGEPAPEVTREALYHAVKAGERFAAMGDG